MPKKLRIGTRESQLAVWQANLVKSLLHQQGIDAELVYIKSEGDIDLVTPLYAMGVQGIFTRSLDQALLNNRIDLAVHSMKDVPVKLPDGIIEAAVLERDNPFDLLVPHPTQKNFELEHHHPVTIASSSLRRKAQWLQRFPNDRMEDIRGNVNTRLKKLENSSWWGAIFAAAGLERIGLRPSQAIELHWMIPAPAQGAILAVCREKDADIFGMCRAIHHEVTASCVKIERDFLAGLLGGCSTPIGALAELDGDEIYFRGNLLDHTGGKMLSIEKRISTELAAPLGTAAAHELLRTAEMNYWKKNYMPDRRYTILSTASIPFERFPNIPESVNLQVIPLLKIVPRGDESLKNQTRSLAEEQKSVVFTSAHAVRWVKKQLTGKPDWKIYCTRYETRRANHRLAGY